MEYDSKECSNIKYVPNMFLTQQFKHVQKKISFKYDSKLLFSIEQVCIVELEAI